MAHNLLIIKFKGDVFIPIINNKIDSSGGNKYGKLFSNTIIFALSTFSSKVLSIIMLPFYTSVLSTANFSTAGLIFSSGNLITPIASIGIAESIIRFGLDKSYKKSDVFSTGIMVTLVGFVLTLLLAPLISASDSIGEYTVLIYLYVIMACLKSVCAQFVRSRGLVKLFAIDGIVSTFLVVILNILLLSVFKYGVVGYVLSTIIADFISIIFLFWAGNLHKFLKIKISPTVTKAMLLFAIPMIPNALSWWVTNASDRFIVQYFWGDSVNGVYDVAYRIPTVIAAISMIFSKAWQISAFTEKTGLERERFFSNIFKLYQMFIITAVSGIILIVKPATAILVSKDFYGSWQYVPLLVLGVGFSCFVTFLGSIYMTEKKNVMSMVTTISGAVLNVILNLLLIPKYGPQGAAFATCFSFIFVFVFRAINTRSLIRVDYGVIRLFACTIIVFIQISVSLAEGKYCVLFNILAFLAIVLIYGVSFMYDRAKRKRQRRHTNQRLH